MVVVIGGGGCWVHIMYCSYFSGFVVVHGPSLAIRATKHDWIEPVTVDAALIITGRWGSSREGPPYLSWQNLLAPLNRERVLPALPETHSPFSSWIQNRTRHHHEVGVEGWLGTLVSVSAWTAALFSWQVQVLICRTGTMGWLIQNSSKIISISVKAFPIRISDWFAFWRFNFRYQKEIKIGLRHNEIINNNGNNRSGTEYSLDLITRRENEILTCTYQSLKVAM